MTNHFKMTGQALKSWLIAQTQDALAVGFLWLVGLWVIGVPWAALWATLAALLQFIPGIGAVLGLIGPVGAAVFSGRPERAIWVLCLYGLIVVVDGVLLQPYLMRRTTKVPIWASIVAPIVLGILVPFWGVILAAPLLAVVYAYRGRAAGAAGREGERAA